MLVNIIANYLDVSVEQAQAVMNLMTLEKRWSEDIVRKDKSYNLATAITHADFLDFLQAVGQAKWFGGQDRTKFPTQSDLEIKQQYLPHIKSLGMMKKIPYPAELPAPAFVNVLGSHVPNVKMRLNTLMQEAPRTIPTQYVVFATGSNRELGKFADISLELEMKQRLEAEQKPATEMNMLSALTQEKVTELNQIYTLDDMVQFKPINTTVIPADQARVNTADTATSLKQALEREPSFETLSRPILVEVISNQPFVERQARDTQKNLGPDFKVVGVGDELTEDMFYSNPLSVSVCLGEVARLININYIEPKLVKTPLNSDELEEIRVLMGRGLNAERSASPRQQDKAFGANSPGVFGSVVANSTSALTENHTNRVVLK